MAVMIGQLHWAMAATLGLDQINRPFFWSPLRSSVSNDASNAPKAFSNKQLNLACPGKSVIWFGLGNMLRCAGMHHIIPFHCFEMPDLPGHSGLACTARSLLPP